jgi:hypothetical protein
MVKYSGTRIEIATVKGPVQVPLSIGGVAIKPQLLQVAGQILQILDWLQFTGCKRMHELKKLKNIPQKTIRDLILRQDEDAHMIAQFAIVIITACNSPKNFEKVLADWIAATLTRVRKSGAEISPSAREEKEMANLRKSLEKLENQTKLVEANIERLTAELQEMKSIRRKLEKEKDELQLLPKAMFMDMYMLREIPVGIELEDKLSEAISAFPYLSQAISKKKPFNIEKSVKALIGNK